MAAPAPQSTSGDDRNLVTVDENYLAPSFEDRVAMFWAKHSRTVIGAGAVVAAGLLAYWGFGKYIDYRENQVRSAYAESETSDDLKAFAATHPTSALAGVAHIRLADEAYAAGDFKAAAAAYQAAVPLLTGNPLVQRARLGAAVSPLVAGDVAAARPLLEALANDTTLAGPVRAEGAYHLAVIERDASRPAEARRWATLASDIDLSGLWSQRAMQLLATLPAAPAADAPSAGATPSTAPAATASPATPAPVADDAKVTFPGAK